MSEGYYGLLRGWQHRRQNEITFSSIPDLNGKVAIVTGANSGVGKTATHVLSRRGAKVFMACRSKIKAEEAMAEIRQKEPQADLEFLSYDASSLSAVHTAALTFLDRNLPLDMLLLNAGTILGEPKASQDGLEWMFAVNHLAHFVLAMTLLPAMEKAAKKRSGDVRIVSTTSAGFTMHPDPATLHIDDAELEVSNPKCWWKGTMPMYGRSKTCNILFAAELSRRLRKNTAWGKAVRSNAIHPGTVSSTTLNVSVRSSWFLYIAETIVSGFVAIPQDMGALNLLYTATSDEVCEKDISGKYLTPYGYVNSAPEGKAASSEKLAEELWQRSVKLCKNHVPEMEVPNI